MKNGELNEIGEKVLEISGDFEFNPVALEDGYGISPMLDMKQVEKQAKSTNYYSTVKPAEVQSIKPDFMIHDKVAPVNKPVLQYTPKVIPTWAKISVVAGLPLGLLYAGHKGYGFWGYVGVGLVAGLISAMPYNFYQLKYHAKDGKG